MAGTIPAARKHLIESIAAHTRSLKSRSPVSPAEFVKSYYRGVDEDDLRDRTPAALACAATDQLRFGSVRRPGQPLVRVFNPTERENGWTSTHTVVEVVTDDMPFLVDSLAMVLNDCGLALHIMVHPVLHVVRDRAGRLKECSGDALSGARTESWQHIEVDRTTDAAALEDVRKRILSVLVDVRLAVRDWKVMSDKALELSRSVAAGLPGVSRTECAEASAFLAWLADHHFTFMGYREYRLVRGASADRLVPVPGSGMGLLSAGKGRPKPRPSELRGEIRRMAREAAPLIVTKANSVSTVHRATYLDYIGVKIFDSQGRVTGERRFLGLFTSATYSASPRDIPLLRQKVQRVIDLIGVAPVSHDGKALFHVLEGYPRDELFQATVPELVRSARGIVNIYERRRVRLFVRRDPYNRFFSCQLYVPRDRYNTLARKRIEQILLEELAGHALESQVQISESTLARMYTLVRTDPAREVTTDIERIERRIAETLRTWEDRLRQQLLVHFPEQRAEQLADGFAAAFPTAYQEEVTARDVNFRHPGTDRAAQGGAGARAAAASGRSRAQGPAPAPVPPRRTDRNVGPRADAGKLRSADPERTSLSDRRRQRAVDPGPGGHPCGRPPARPGAGRRPLRGGVLRGLERPGRKRRLQPTRARRRPRLAPGRHPSGRSAATCCRPACLSASATWNPCLRGIPASRPVSRGPSRRASILRLKDSTRASQLRSLGKEIDEALEQVTSPDDDRILRAFRAVIGATLRTNHYQVDASGQPKPYLSLKLDPKSLPELPKPRPMFEICVYSPRVEGVHLRWARSPAAACAGPTGARTSAPRCWG